MYTLFDYQAFDLQTHGGISHGVLEFYSHMPSDISVSIGVVESDNIYLKELGLPSKGELYASFMLHKKFKGKRYLFDTYFKLKNHYNYWKDCNQNYCRWLLQTKKVDIFHPTFYDDYFLPYLGNIPFVLTVHDMIPELFPCEFSESDFQIQQKKKLVPMAKHIVVPSQNTKDDLMRVLGVPESKISVVYRGAEITKWEKMELFDKELSQNPYILYVGGRKGYKNFSYFFESVAPLLKKNSNLCIICTGNPFSKEELAKFSQYNLQGRFVHIYSKSDYELAKLYHNAIAFVFPSLYEGFGLPIVESYQAGGLLVLNEASCFPEIAGYTAIYFSQDKRKCNLTETLEYVLQMSNEERCRQLAKQQKRLKLYSWEKASAQLAEVYRRVAAE